MLTGLSRQVTGVHVREVLNYDTYLVDDILFDKLGFGRTREEECELVDADRGKYAKAWASVPRMIADGLGVELAEILDERDVWYTPDAIVHDTWSIGAGTVAAVRFRVLGIVAGRAAITMEHITRLDRRAAPDWPQPPGAGGYQVRIEGVPSFELDLALDEPGGDPNIAALTATAMRAVHAIPHVIDAPAGIISCLDLPPILGRRVFADPVGVDL
jgi:4-hydroxy-tetrahydrodipicolinate reductase